MAPSSAPSPTVRIENALARSTTAETTWRLEVSSGRSRMNSRSIFMNETGRCFGYAETAEAGAEVVKGHLAPHVVEALDEGLGGCGVAQERGLGDLADDGLRRRAIKQ